MSTLTMMWMDTVFFKLPIHALAKSVPIAMCIDPTNAQGAQERHWSVSPNAAHGSPQTLICRLNTLGVYRRWHALKHLSSSLICLGKLWQIGQELERRWNTAPGNLKRAFYQNARVCITSQLRHRGLENQQWRLKAHCNHYGVNFAGSRLWDDDTANALYIILQEFSRQALNSAPTHPVNDGALKSVAQRIFTRLSRKMFAILKYQHTQVSIQDHEWCLSSLPHRYTDRTNLSKQMHKTHESHLRSGYLADVQTETVLNHQGYSDWLWHDTPDPKVQTVYQGFRHQQCSDRSSLPMVAGTDHLGPNGDDASGSGSLAPTSSDIRTAPATALVRHFYQAIHGIADKTPHAKEIEHATYLTAEHGIDFAMFFVQFACRTARQKGFKPHVFGGLMRYEEIALTAYRHYQARKSKASIEAADTRTSQLRQQYAKDRQAQVADYRACLSPRGSPASKASVTRN